MPHFIFKPCPLDLTMSQFEFKRGSSLFNSQIHRELVSCPCNYSNFMAKVSMQGCLQFLSIVPSNGNTSKSNRIHVGSRCVKVHMLYTYIRCDSHIYQTIFHRELEPTEVKTLLMSWSPYIDYVVNLKLKRGVFFKYTYYNKGRIFNH